ncbi:high-potential iron-sulfur protein [Sphingobium sufflavum]|uniref:high-potential iron-sulfur protein n=1 Tax=Sphingobium sufflavum TaxID=1129547 RepID=UPI001F2166BC|nr:high-potential iron-sulfur protein [Sphingobium sufflavum]MCE7798282.1 high-potential iron-sulfur protein [Sphingobium sufflavum]
MRVSRRDLLSLCAVTPLTMLAAAEAVAAPPACSSGMALSQMNRRSALGYVDVSKDRARHCSLCTFFAAGEGGCGTCQLLSGGSVSAGGVCTSFVARAAAQ